MIVRLPKSVMRVAMGLFVLTSAAAAAMAAGGGNGGSSGGSSGGGAGCALTINNDSNAAAEYARAQTAIAQVDYETAIGHLDKVLAAQPNNPDVLNLMGFSKRKLGDQSEALEYYNKALDLQPNHFGANEYLGELYLELKNVTKAQQRLAVLQQGDYILDIRRADSYV